MAHNSQQFKEIMAQAKNLENQCWLGFKSLLEKVVAGEKKGFRIIMMSKEESKFCYEGISFFLRSTQDFEKGYIEMGYIEELENEENQYHVTHQYTIDLEGNVMLNNQPCNQCIEEIGDNFDKILDEVKKQMV